MNIKPSIYENLTHDQRIIATVEAQARDDEAEKQRLIDTCPKGVYKRNESDYADRMEALEILALLVEYAMCDAALNLMVHMHVESRNNSAARPSFFSTIQKTPESIEDILCMYEAWHEMLQEEGINSKKAEKAFGKPRHNIIKLVLDIADDDDMQADPDIVKKYKTYLKDYLKRASA